MSEIITDRVILEMASVLIALAAEHEAVLKEIWDKTWNLLFA